MNEVELSLVLNQQSGFAVCREDGTSMNSTPRSLLSSDCTSMARHKNAAAAAAKRTAVMSLSRIVSTQKRLIVVMISCVRVPAAIGQTYVSTVWSLNFNKQRWSNI